MSTTNTLMAMGFQAEQAKAVAKGTTGTLTATGSTIADAAALVADTTLVTSASGAGVQLPDKDGSIVVAHDGSNDTLVYPHSASGIINGGSAGAGYALDTTAGGGIFIRLDNLNWVAIGTHG